MGDEELLLASRMLVYSILARAFAEEPNELLLDTLSSDQLRISIDMIDDTYRDSLERKLEEINELVEHRGDISTDLCIQILSDEYNRVFVGPDTLHAAPWESMHRTGSRRLFQPEVLEIRRAYREAGLLPERYPEVSDDFIGLELDFMAKMSRFALDSFEARGMADYVEWLRRSKSFLDEHLLAWIDSLADSVRKNYPEGFYAPVTEFAALFAKRDDKALTCLLEENDR